MSHPDEKTIILRRPVEFAGKTYTELQLREPTLGEFADACKHEGVTSDIFLIAAVTGLEIPAVRKISYRDAKEARDFLAVFIDSPGDWRDAVAEVTCFYHWGPREAWSLTWRELMWWHDQAVRMLKAGRGR